MNKFDVAKIFNAGFIAGIGNTEGIDPNKPPHWHAGYAAGYRWRPEKNGEINTYLKSIGMEPMGVISLCGKPTEFPLP